MEKFGTYLTPKDAAVLISALSKALAEGEPLLWLDFGKPSAGVTTVKLNGAGYTGDVSYLDVVLA